MFNIFRVIDGPNHLPGETVQSLFTQSGGKLQTRFEQIGSMDYPIETELRLGDLEIEAKRYVGTLRVRVNCGGTITTSWGDLNKPVGTIVADICGVDTTQGISHRYILVNSASSEPK